MSNHLSKLSLLIIPLVLAAAFLLVPSIPRAHAATGLVCIANGGLATSCPGGPVTIPNQAAGSSLTISVFVSLSDPMGGFDIYVKTDNTVLNPVSAKFGPLIASPSLSIICINNVPQSGGGACTAGTANAAGVVEMETIESSGQNECLGQPTCSGRAFNITYTVGAATGTTAIAYPKAAGCSSSTTDPTDCVLVFDNFGTVLSENIQPGTYGAAAAVTSLVSVVTGTDGNLYSSSFTGTWGSWTPLAGQSPSSPALCQSGTTTAELVVRGADQGIYHKTFTDPTWQASWDKNPTGLTIDSPACAVIGTTLYVVVRGAGDELFATTFDLTARTWAASWTDLLGSTPTVPSLVATPAQNRLDLVVMGDNKGIFHKSFTVAGGWAAAWDTPAIPQIAATISSPAIASDGTLIHVIVRGTESNVWYATVSFTGVWSGFTFLGGSTPTAPVLVIDASNTLHVLVKGFDNQLYSKNKPSAAAFDATWANAGGVVSSVSAAVTSSGVSAVVVGVGNNIWYNTLSGSTWAGYSTMNGQAGVGPGVSGA